MPADFAFRPRSAGEIIDVAVRIVRANFGTAAALGALAAAPSLVAQLVLVASDQMTPGTFGLSTLLLWAVGVVVASIVGGAVFDFADRALRGMPQDLGASLGRGVRRAPALFAVTIGTGFVAAIGFILLIVPGIYLLVRLVAASPAAVLEDVGPMEAIDSSWNRTRGRAGHAFGALALTVVVYVVPLFVASMVGGILAAVVGLGVGGAASEASPVPAILVVSVLSLLVSTVAYPFLWSAILVLYYDLRVRSEGYDLEAMAAELDGASAL